MKRNRAMTKPEPAKTRGYEPLYHTWWNRVRDLPPFSFTVIRYMMLDSQIRLNLATRSAPLSGLEFAYEEENEWISGIKADTPEVADFIERQLARVWQNHLKSIVKAQAWGWSAGEIVTKISKDKLIEIDRLEPRQSIDCRILHQNGERHGVRVNRVRGSEKGYVDLQFPYAYWHNHDPDEGEEYGNSILLGAYSPWADKWLNGGAQDVRRLFMHKDAYGGCDVSYPPGETYIGDADTATPNVDIARQIAEQNAAGGVTTRPSERDEQGNEKWTITRATVPANPAHILEYPKDLDAEMRRGMEIPDDVIDSGEGAWAGKRVPLAAFYASLDCWARDIYGDLRVQCLDRLVLLNFGKAIDYEINHKPLAEQAMEQQSNAGEGQEQPPQMGEDFLSGLGGGGGEPEAEPLKMSLLTPANIIRAAQSLIDAEAEPNDEPSESEPEDADFEFNAERIEAMAEMLAAVYGDDALAMLEKMDDDKPKRLAVWNPDDHPRGPNGRFIKRGTTEAFELATAKVNEAHKSKSPESMADLMGHMNTLTVAQLHKLKKDFGTTGSAKTKADLIAKLSERLTSGRHRLARKDDDTPVAPVNEEVYSVPTSSLKVDPKRFQYKVKGIGDKGVGEELKGTSKWNPELGGVLLVWRDPQTDQDYVVNGHHRHELASRTETGEVNVRYIDAPNAKSARAKGALANIAEGRGTALDAAKYLRDSDRDVDHLRDAGISLSGKVASDATVLTQLGNKAFQQVTEGMLSEDKAIAVAKFLPDHDLQDKLFKKLERREDDGKEWTLSQISQAAKKMKAAGTVKQSGTDLFGDFDTEESTFDQEVEIEAYISRNLARTANDFGAVANTRRADRVKEAGNTLAVEENAKRRDSAREAQSDFDRESGLKGAVADLVKKFAALLAGAKKRKDRDKIKKDALEAFRESRTSSWDNVNDQTSGDRPSGLQELLKKPKSELNEFEGFLAMSLRKQYGDKPGEWSLSDEEAAEVEAGTRLLLRMGGGIPMPKPAKDTSQEPPPKKMGIKRMATGRAPKGGISIGGKFYPGGKFIPGTTQEQVDAAVSGAGDADDPKNKRPAPRALSPSAKRQKRLAKKKASKPAPAPQAPPQAAPLVNDNPDTKIDNEPTTPPPPGKAFRVNVEETDEKGVGKTARVGVPGRHVPPPPPIPKLPNLTKRERDIESRFIDAYMADPEGMAERYRKEIVYGHPKGGAKAITFETDGAKLLSADWKDKDPDTQMRKRHLNNLALHGTANAITKRAFLQHLDTLKPGDNVLVTVGGCGAGKGFTLGSSDRGKELSASAGAIWDSAGDQNATENPWILDEATERGLKVTYAFVNRNPKTAWEHPKQGVVYRAHDNGDGRMVDAAVYADSYAQGLKNHHAFHQAEKNNPNAEFLFMQTDIDPDTKEPVTVDLPGIPEQDRSIDRKELLRWADQSIRSRTDVDETVLRGATLYDRVWNEEYGSA